MDTKNNQKQIVCVTALNNNLEADIDSRFGRCQYFLIINIENKKIKDFKAINNTALAQGHGSGISAARIMADYGVNIVISGNFGPKASMVLEELGIKMSSDSGIVKNVVKKYLKNL